MLIDDLDYDQFVVVAEKEWNLYFEGYSPIGFGARGSRTLRMPVTIGDTEWQISSHDHGHTELSIHLTCTSVTERSASQVHLEVHGYCRHYDATSFGPGLKHWDARSASYVTTPLRHIFKRNDNSAHFTATIGSNHNAHILFIVRVLKDRAEFPDFSSPAVRIGSQLESNVKLHVGNQQIFHANKEVLSAHSTVFDRMFNGEFKEANREEVELQHEATSPALFEEFLLVLCFPDALPKRKNLVGLIKLADYYDADNVREKCKRHFQLCREMPVEERHKMALELGNEQQMQSKSNMEEEEEEEHCRCDEDKAAADGNGGIGQIGAGISCFSL